MPTLQQCYESLRSPLAQAIFKGVMKAIHADFEVRIYKHHNKFYADFGGQRHTSRRRRELIRFLQKNGVVEIYYSPEVKDN